MGCVLRVETENIFVEEGRRTTLPARFQEAGTANSGKTGGETVMGGRSVKELLAIRRPGASQLELNTFQVCGGFVEITVGCAAESRKHCARTKRVGWVGARRG